METKRYHSEAVNTIADFVASYLRRRWDSQPRIPDRKVLTVSCRPDFEVRRSLLLSVLWRRERQAIFVSLSPRCYGFLSHIFLRDTSFTSSVGNFGRITGVFAFAENAGICSRASRQSQLASDSSLGTQIDGEETPTWPNMITAISPNKTPLPQSPMARIDSVNSQSET